jgi:hypothetical protein
MKLLQNENGLDCERPWSARSGVTTAVLPRLLEAIDVVVL